MIIEALSCYRRICASTLGLVALLAFAAADAASPQVSASGDHSAAVMSDGSLWAWGYNGSGQIGDGTTTDRNLPIKVGTGYIAVAAGHDHTYHCPKVRRQLVGMGE